MVYRISTILCKKKKYFKHAKETYIELYNYLMRTDILNFYSSGAFEFTWHLIFSGSHSDVTQIR